MSRQSDAELERKGQRSHKGPALLTKLLRGRADPSEASRERDDAPARERNRPGDRSPGRDGR